MASEIEDNDVAKAFWENLSDATALDAGTKTSLRSVLGVVIGTDVASQNDTRIEPQVKNASFTAANGETYNVVASATVTDPSPVEGKGFAVFVRNGTATVGAVAYATAGTIILRTYHSGTWGSKVYQDMASLLAAENTWTGTQIFGGGFTVNGSAVFGPLASFTYIGSEAAHRTALGLGTAATSDTGDFATAAQGTLADTAVQPAALTDYLPLAGGQMQGNLAMGSFDISGIGGLFAFGGGAECDLPSAGGTLSTLAGAETLANKTLTNPTVNNFTEGVVSIGNSGTSQTLALTNGTFQTVTLTGNCTFTMPTATAGKSFILKVLTGAGSYTATFTGVKWSGGTAPTITPTASKYDLISFVADGTAWSGSSIQNFTA